MVETVDTSTQKEKTTDEEMKELYETSMRNLQEGNILTGTVINITTDSIIVDVGLKSEGKVPLDEFLDRSGAPTVKIGDEVRSGETVCILEAMKMFNELKAPSSGKVREVNIKKGSVVALGDLLVLIE